MSCKIQLLFQVVQEAWTNCALDADRAWARKTSETRLLEREKPVDLQIYCRICKKMKQKVRRIFNLFKIRLL